MVVKITKSDFSKILRNLRKKRNLTQQYMADFLNISQAAYARYEKGDRQPSIEMLIELAEFFNVSLDILTGRYVNAFANSANIFENSANCPDVKAV